MDPSACNRLRGRSFELACLETFTALCATTEDERNLIIGADTAYRAISLAQFARLPVVVDRGFSRPVGPPDQHRPRAAQRPPQTAVPDPRLHRFQ
jgi:hypothetical protein